MLSACSSTELPSRIKPEGLSVIQKENISNNGSYAYELCSPNGGAWGCDKYKPTEKTPVSVQDPNSKNNGNKKPFSKIIKNEIKNKIKSKSNLDRNDYEDKGVPDFVFYFGFDSYLLNELDYPMLDVFFKKIGDKNIDVVGYTDSAGGFLYNDYLSKKRAEEVKSIFIKKGFDGSKITTKGLGFCCYVKAKDSQLVDMAKSRRVEIFLND